MKMRRLDWKPDSDVGVSAVLQRNIRPVVFWSRTLNSNEKRYASVEKEASAIVEAVRRWSHYLLLRKFTIIIDKKIKKYLRRLKKLRRHLRQFVKTKKNTRTSMH